ncbi:hypothetical protein NBO_359g0007 [Nosema bombycis CQ1]|uniref:Uncharacterized protein n=1 Tax=Nosema bombycis (strain CQ1 / CVCC 102059) TaxID=578461 RepID=R0MJA3_NOSB1|nr:hypothetical protein NBO_359g0007 [Nosema bombycis CQ1]|eukprot:EOB12848.1 hypothetical protein NBO_359g0007 [Nosema bombycis CQ1]
MLSLLYFSYVLSHWWPSCAQKDPCRGTNVKVVDKIFGCVNVVVLRSVLD